MMRVLMAGVAVLSLVAVGCGGDKSSGSNGPKFSCDKVQPAGFPTTAEGVEVGQTLVDQDFVDTEDNARCTRDFTGHVTFISIGTGWCPPCQSETPGIVDVYNEFKGQGFEVVQVMYEDYDGGSPDPEFMQQWHDEYDIPYTLVPDNPGDFYNNLVPPCGNNCYIPHNILVNKDGVITYSDSGSLSESGLRTRVNGIIDDEPVLSYED